MPQLGHKRSVLVRVEEWTEWLPVTPIDVGHVTTKDRGTVHQTMPLHKGYTAFSSNDSEKLVELYIEPTGRFYTWENDGKQQVYGLYLFRAMLANNNLDESVVLKKISDQRKPLVNAKKAEKENNQGRDKRNDLVIAQHVPKAPQPNRHQRRKKRG